MRGRSLEVGGGDPGPVPGQRCHHRRAPAEDRVTDYQSAQFAREAHKAQLAEMSLLIKILEHALETTKLSERHAHRRLQELQDGAGIALAKCRGYLQENAETGFGLAGETATWRLLGYLAPLEHLLPHEEAS